MGLIPTILPIALLCFVTAQSFHHGRPHRCFELLEGQKVYVTPQDTLREINLIEESDCRSSCVHERGCSAYTYWKYPKRNCVLSRSTVYQPAESYAVSGIMRTDCSERTGRKLVYISDAPAPMSVVRHTTHQRCFELLEGQKVYVTPQDTLRELSLVEESDCRSSCAHERQCSAYTYFKYPKRNCVLSRSTVCRPAGSYAVSGIMRTDCSERTGRKLVYISEVPAPMPVVRHESHQRCFELLEGQKVYVTPQDTLREISLVEESDCRSSCAHERQCSAYTYFKYPKRNCVLSRSTVCRPAGSYAVSGIMRTDCSERTGRKLVYISEVPAPMPVVRHARQQRCFELYEGQKVYVTPQNTLREISLIEESDCRSSCLHERQCSAYTYWNYPKKNCVLSRSTVCQPGESYAVSGILRTDCSEITTVRKLVYVTETNDVRPGVPYVAETDNILTRFNLPDEESFHPLPGPPMPENLLTRVNNVRTVVTESDVARRVYVPKLRRDAICVDRYQDFLNEGIEVLEKRSVSDEEECVTVCNEHSLCSAYSFFPFTSTSTQSSCWLHRAFTGEMAFQKDTVSGSLRDCKIPYQPTLIHSSMNYKVISDFIGLGVTVEFGGASYCWEMCRNTAGCLSASYCSRSNACFLRSTTPDLNTPNAEPGAAMAVRLTGKFNFFPDTNLASGFYSYTNTLEKREMVFNVRDCEDLCLARSDCSAYIHSLNEARCHLMGGYVDDMDMVNNQPNFAMGVRDGSRLCWRQFHGQRNPSMSFFIRLLNNVPDAVTCRMKCKQFAGCKAFTFSQKSYGTQGQCVLKRKLDDRMTLLDNTAVSAALVNCANRHSDFHVMNGFQFDFQPEVYRTAVSDDFAQCSDLCTADSECASYFFYPETCYLMSSVPMGMFRADHARFGVKLTGQFRAFQWRRFEITPEMNAVRVEAVSSGRACEEECLKRSCSAYVFNFRELYCDLVPNPVAEEAIITDGYSLAGFRPAPQVVETRTVIRTMNYH